MVISRLNGGYQVQGSSFDSLFNETRVNKCLMLNANWVAVAYAAVLSKIIAHR